MTIEKLFETLKSTFGLAELERDEDGSVALTVDENLGARIFPLPPANDESGAPEQLVVAVILGPIGMFPPSAAVELLSANYLWESTAGGSFSLDEETGMVVLQRLFSLDEIDDSEAFVDDFAYLVGAARAVRQQIGITGEAANAEQRLLQSATCV